MSEAKFTPGPWLLAIDEKSGGTAIPPAYHEICCVEAPGNFDAIEVYASEFADDPLPNAKLIAAAPLMYEACKDVLPQLEACQDIRRARLVRAALAAADG